MNRIAWSVILCISLIFATSFSPAASGAAAAPDAKAKAAAEDWEAKWMKTAEAAGKEGEAMVYATLGPSTINLLTSNMKAKYGIQLSFVNLGQGAAVAERIVREKRAGLHVVDVIIMGATSLVQSVKPAGALDRIEPVLILPEVLDRKAWRNGSPFIDKERKLVPTIASFLRHVTRNTDLVKEGEIKSYKDLLNPKWKGKIILNDPTTGGAGNSWVSLMASAWGLEPTRDFLKQLVKQEPVITRDGRLQVETMARGKYALAIATRVEVTHQFMALGSHIAPVRTMEGGTITGSGGVLALPTNRPHPQAATVLINWLMTREGQAVFSKGFGSPASRLDVAPPADLNPLFLPEPGEAVQIEDEEDLKIKGSVLLDLAKEALAPLFK